MSKEREQISSREQRHRERVRRWRRQQLKSFAINGGIIAVAAGLVLLVNTWAVNRTSEVEESQSAGNILPEQLLQEEEPVQEEITPEMVSFPIVQTAPTLSDGEVMILTENCIRKNKEFVFTAKVDIMGVLVFRHGENAYGASWINLDREKVEIYTHSDMARKQLEVEHGLSFGGNLKVVIKTGNDETMDLTITSQGKTFSVNDVVWMGHRGAVEVESIGNELTDVSVSWDAEDIKKDVWILGDGYLGTHARNRWPYYVLGEGYDNALYSGLYNTTSKRMYEEWQQLLTYGTPKYAVWCLGMNDTDSEDRVNSNWKECTEQFLDDCKQRGITPILATIPNTVKKNHVFKNEFVRNSGHRYVDFALVVGASKKDSVWLGGMLSGDKIHPTNAGAEALAEQFIKDVPEIKGIPEEKPADKSEKVEESTKTEE